MLMVDLGIVDRDWKTFSQFYEEAFGCIRVPPERHFSGEWLDKGTGVKDARFSGVHLRLPGFGTAGPTLEILQYGQSERKLSPRANREGFSHIAFEVEDVSSALDDILKHGGTTVGQIVSREVEGVGLLTFVYAADPEGNIIELQAWK